MHFLEYLFIRLIAFLFRIMPLKLAEWAANLMAFFLEDIIRYRRTVIIKNLNLVYGAMWPKPAAQLLKEIYRNFVYLWFEVLQGARFDLPQIRERMTLHDKYVMDEALAPGRGALLLTGHFGNFEWIGDLVAGMGYDIAAVAKRQKNRRIDAYLRRLRQRYGTKIIYTGQAIKQGLGQLKNRGIVGLVADQYAGEKGVEIPFVNLPSSVFAGPAIYHLRTGAPMFYIICLRRAYARFDVHFIPVPSAEEFIVTDENIKKVTQTQSAVLEKWLLAYPEQWFWSHKRWKNLTDYRGPAHIPGGKTDK